MPTELKSILKDTQITCESCRLCLQAGTTFILESADGGIGVLGSDARVWIKNTGGGLLERVRRDGLI